MEERGWRRGKKGEEEEVVVEGVTEEKEGEEDK